MLTDLSITKTHVGNFAAGTNGTFTLAVSNVGNGATTGAITVTDTLNASFSFVSGTAAGWNCGAVGQLVTCTNSGPIAPGTSAASIPLIVGVSASAAGSIGNTATVATAGDTIAANNSSTDSVTVLFIDLSITKTQTGAFTAGTNGTYTIAVSNLGNEATTGTITVTDTLPAGLTFVSGTAAGWTCSAVGQVVTCTNTGPINGGTSAASIPLIVAVSASASGNISNTATVATAGDNNAANNSSTNSSVTIAPDLAITKTHTGNFTAGTNGTFNIAVSNVGNGATTGAITVTDTLNSFVHVRVRHRGGVGLRSGGSGGDVHQQRADRCGSLRHAIPLVVGVSASASGSIGNTATVATAGDSNAGNNSSTDNVTVQLTDLSITKSHAGGFTAGSNGTFNIAVSNVGNQPTTGTITVSDTLNSAFTFVSGTATGWVCGAAGQVVTCTNSGPIAASTSAATIPLVVAVSGTASGSIGNTATVATAGDSNATNNSSTDSATVQLTDLSITKSHTGNFTAGSSGTFNIAVSNVGNQPTTGTITVSDTLNSAFTFVSGTATGWACGAAGQVVTCTNSGPIAAGGSATTIPLVVAVSGTASGSIGNTATVATAGDSNAGNNSSTDNVTVQLTDLSITKSHTGNFTAGSNGTFNIAVSNVGNQPTTGTITVSDTLNSAFTFVSGTATGWACGAAGQVVTCTNSGPIAAGGSATTIPLVVGVSASASGSIGNTATVATAGDSNAGNNSSTDNVTVQLTDLSITKSHAGGFTAGSNGTFNIAVSNVGNQPTTGTITVSDTLNSAFTFVSGTATGWVCGAAGQVVTCTNSGPIAAGGSATTIPLVVGVSASASGSIGNTATVATAGDINAANNSSTDNVTVTLSSDLSITKDDGVTSVNANGSTTYTVRVTNAGPSSVTGAILKDAAATGLTKTVVACSAASLNQCASAPSTATLESVGGVTLPALNNGQFYELTVTANVTALSGSVTNVATVTAPAGTTDPSGVNNIFSDTDTVSPVSDLGITKTNGVTAVTPSGSTTYTVRVTNNGPEQRDERDPDGRGSHGAEQDDGGVLGHARAVHGGDDAVGGDAAGRDVCVADAG